MFVVVHVFASPDPFVRTFMWICQPKLWNVRMLADNLRFVARSLTSSNSFIFSISRKSYLKNSNKNNPNMQQILFLCVGLLFYQLPGMWVAFRNSKFSLSWFALGFYLLTWCYFYVEKRPMEQAIPSWKSNQSRLLYVKINEFLPQKVGGCFKGRFLTLMLMGTEK